MLHHVQLHHIVPKGNGGDDSIENAIPLCPNCHNEVHGSHASGRTTRAYTPDELKLHIARTAQRVENGNKIIGKIDELKSKVDSRTGEVLATVRRRIVEGQAIDVSIGLLQGIDDRRIREDLLDAFSKFPAAAFTPASAPETEDALLDDPSAPEWITDQRDRLREAANEVDTRGRRLTDTASRLNPLIRRHLDGINAQLLRNKGRIFDYTKEPVLPADFAACRLLAPHFYHGTDYSEFDPVVWRLFWIPVRYPADWAVITVVLVPPRKGDPPHDWKFAVSVNPVDLQREQYGPGRFPERSGHGYLTKGTEEADLSEELSKACERGRDLFL
jgi:hypothetical protein